MFYILVFIISAVVFATGPFLFKYLGIVDRPDGVRKQHKGEIALSEDFVFSFV